MDRLAEQILTGDGTLPLFLLASPWIGLGAFVGYFALNKLRNGKSNGRSNGADSQISVAGVHGQMEALKAMVKQVLDRTHALESAISALRKENRARADSDAHLRERVAIIEGRQQGHDGRTR